MNPIPSSVRRAAVVMVALLLFSSSAPAQPPLPVPPLPGVELPPLPPPQPPGVPVGPVEPAGPPVAAPGQPDPAPPTAQESIDALQDELDQANAEVIAAQRANMLPAGWPDLRGVDLLPSIRDVVPFSDRPVPVLLDIFQVTLFKLPAGEAVVDIVTGDPLFFETSGEGTEVFVKPMEVPRRTSLLLTTSQGTDYSFDLFATEAYLPDVQLRLQTARPQPEPVPRRRPEFQLRFGTLADLQSRRAELVGLRDRVSQADQNATREIADLDTLREARLTAVRRTYAESIEQRYWLSQDLVEPPLSVSQIWTDGQFTFLRSTAQEAPALYALSPDDPDEPILVNYDLKPDGLYIVDHVMSAGWAQVGDVRAEWGVWESPSLDRLDDLDLPLRPGPPDLNVPLAVGRTQPRARGFWGGKTGKVLGAVFVGVAGYGLWRTVDL